MWREGVGFKHCVCMLAFLNSFIHSNILHASNSNSDFKSVSLAQQQAGEPVVHVLQVMVTEKGYNC